MMIRTAPIADPSVNLSEVIMTQYYYLLSTYSLPEYDNQTGPLVFELGSQIDGTSYYSLVLAPQQFGGKNLNQLWTLSESDGGTQIASAANPTLQLGWNNDQLINYNLQVVAYAPQSGDANIVWTVSDANNGNSKSVLIGNAAANSAGGWNYYLSTYNNYENNVLVSGATAILNPPGDGSIPDSSYYIIEECNALEVWRPIWVYLQTTAPDAQSVSGNFVIGFAGGVVQPNSQPTLQVFQPGSIDQLWGFYPDGTIRSAADTSLAITAGGYNTSVTVQTLGGNPSSSQVWAYQISGSGKHEIFNSGTNNVLSVANNSALPNQSIVPYESYNGSGQIWNFIPPSSLSGQFFTINTVLGTSAPMMLTANTDGAVLMETALDTRFQQPTVNQLWRRTLDGRIVSALNPALALSAPSAGGAVSLAPAEPKNLLQCWTWNPLWGAPITVDGTSTTAGALVNLGLKDQYLTVQDGGTASGTPACTEAADIVTTGQTKTLASQQLWYVQPAGPAYGNWTTIRSTRQVQEDGRTTTPLLLTINVTGTEDVPNNWSGPVYLNEQAAVDTRAGGPTSIWQFTSEGYIVNSFNPDLILSLEIDTATSTLLQPAYTNSVVVSLRTPMVYSGQLWTATSDGVIFSRHNGQALTVNGTYDPTNPAPVAVVTSALASPPTAAQIWDFGTGKGLQAVLAQPGLPFPPVDQDDYQSINQQLDLGGTTLREQYSNLAAPLAGYQAALAIMQLNNPSLSTSIQQLSKELSAAMAAQSLFEQVGNLHINLAMLQNLALQEIVTLLKLPPTQTLPRKKSHAWIWDIVQGVVYTALNIAGTEIGDPALGTELETVAAKTSGKTLSAVANIWQTGFTAGQAAIEANSNNPAVNIALGRMEQLDMTIAELQSSLLAAFKQSGYALGVIESDILSDWGKMQRVYEMIRTPIGTSSLYWPGTMGPMQANKLLGNYIIQVLQILLPMTSDWGITFQTMHGPRTQPRDQLGLQPDGLTYIQYTKDGQQNTFVAHEQNGNMLNAIMPMIWENGGIPYNYFNCVSGWNFGTTYDYNGSYNSAAIVVVLVNKTSQPLMLYATAQGILGPGGNTSEANQNSNVWRPLPAFGMTGFAGINVPGQAYSSLPFDGEFYLYAGTEGGEGGTSQAQVAHIHIGTSYATFNWTIDSTANGYAVAISPGGGSSDGPFQMTVIVSPS
jgi:hypothetical protein